MKERLGSPPSYADREYSHPKQFLEDMRLIWANCRRYNREMTEVRKWGEALSDMFEKRWHASGIEPKWAEEDQRQLIEQVVCAPLYRVLGFRGSGCRPGIHLAVSSSSTTRKTEKKGAPSRAVRLRSKPAHSASGAQLPCCWVSEPSALVEASALFAQQLLWTHPSAEGAGTLCCPLVDTTDAHPHDETILLGLGLRQEGPNCGFATQWAERNHAR